MSAIGEPLPTLSTDSPARSTRYSPYPFIPSSSPVTPHRPALRLSPSTHESRHLPRPLNRTRASLEEVQHPRGSSRVMDRVERVEAGPSRPREALALPRGAGSAAGSRGGSDTGRRAVTETIDLTGDSSEDEVEVVRERIVVPRAVAAPFRPQVRIASPPPRRAASPARRRLEDDEYREQIYNADRAIDRHGRGLNALFADEGPRREQYPPPPARAAPRPRIGLGGAVVRNGGQQINYDAQRNRHRREVRVQNDWDEYRPPQADDADDNDLFDIPGAYNIGRNHRGPAAEARANAIRNVRREDEAARDADIRRQLRRSAAMRRDMEQERRALEEEEVQYRHLDPGWMHRLGGLVGLGLGRFGMGGANANAIAAAMDGVGLHGFGGQAGRAPLDIDSLTVKVDIPTHQVIRAGFVDNWDLEANRPIELDDAGDAIKPAFPMYLRCGDCDEPLLLSSAYESPEDRVWALRCGHMVHEGCLGKISTPAKGQTANITHFRANGAVLDDDGPSKKKKKSTSKKVPKPSVFRWQCPVGGCGVWHASEKKVDEEKWTQTEDAGALAVYA